MTTNADVPRDLVALVLTGDRRVCGACVREHPRLLDSPDCTPVLAGDTWKGEVLDGGPCDKCHKPLVND